MVGAIVNVVAIVWNAIRTIAVILAAMVGLIPLRWYLARF
jgi:hypothetical protein